MAFPFDKNLILYSDYSCIRNEELNIDTEYFTKLEGVGIIDEKHPFLAFIRGFVHNNYEINILHGWFHLETKTAKFYVRDNPSKYGDIIHLAWQKYWNNTGNDYNISIYASYCGNIYESNEYEVNTQKTYAKIMKNIFEIFANI